MTVDELISALKAHPMNMRVIVRGYEGGYNDATELVARRIRLDAHEDEDWVFGQHEDVRNADEGPCEDAVEVQGSRSDGK